MDNIFYKYDIDKDKKLENIPIWEFLEIITFGELVSFYDFYTKEYELREESKDIYILRDIVKLRNAVAHRLSEASDNLCYEKKNIMRSWTNKVFFLWSFLVN